MDKTVVFAVAGAGKTQRIVDRLDEAGRFLLVTFTDANCQSLRARIFKRFGYFPENIHLYTYFSFLHSFCYRPFLLTEKRTKGVYFRRPTDERNYPATNDRRFMTASRWLYHNRLASFIDQTGTTKDVIARIEKYFDVFLVDEVQDFAGHDFNLLLALSKARVECTFVGDFYQHTFDTSRDGNVNKSLHESYAGYQKRFLAAKLRVDLDSLVKSRRCSKSVCNFITERLGIRIESAGDQETDVRFTEDAEVVRALYEAPAVVKLFLQEHYKYDCHSQNWGASKGLDHFQDVCVALSQEAVKAWKKGTLAALKPSTRNKLYVACSRPRGNLTFVPESLLRAHKKSAGD